MATLITVRHNFETAHRLPFLKGKCESLHGHSWWAEFELENLSDTAVHGVDSQGISVEYGEVKKLVRAWIDSYLDHGTMLGRDDLLARDPNIRAIMGKVFIFGTDQSAENSFAQRPWPTVESVAFMLCHKVQTLLGNDIFINKVTVQETHVNKAIYLQGV